MGDSSAARAATGIDGLDDILAGGLPRNRMYLVQGDPGVGKTTLSMQFLLEGVRAGETVLYVTLSETKQEVEAVAASHGWSLDGISMFELSALEQQNSLDAENTVFDASEIELHETTRTILEHLEKVKPTRVVFDSLSELRLLALSVLRFRRQILALKQYFAGRDCTVMLLDDFTGDQATSSQLQSLVHGVLQLQQLSPEYGADRRRLRVVKLRGVQFRGGYHDFIIEPGGVEVFPRLVAAEHHAPYERKPLASGVEGLDALLGGGIERGTSTLILGPAGTGKSTLASQYAVAAARRGDKVLFLMFDEARGTLFARSKLLGMGLDEHVEAGRIFVQQVDPAELSPGELAHVARRHVEQHDVCMVIIDSLNGYMHAMPEEKFLEVQLHELLSYFGQRGVSTVLLMAQAGMLSKVEAPADISYIADTVLLLRYFEAGGRIRKAISVVKKRTGPHEDSIRELSMDGDGIHIGEALHQFHGVLTGVPTFVGRQEDLRDK